MNIYEAISMRRSVREFEDRGLPREVLERILVAGTAAPTARNEQGHRTLAVTDPDVIRRLMPHQPHVGTAPCVLALWFEGENRRMQCGISAREQDAAICLSYMVLAALEEGVQGCWLGGFDAEHVKEVLGLPSDVTVVALHTLGYPAGDAPRRQKKEPSTLYEIR